ncbi:MAG: hypothetical protein IJI66_10330 [Erysipelotrichaceae bacterium]|nr:hypothetical protein [Erysipelotrichaceae bacterium]
MTKNSVTEISSLMSYWVLFVTYFITYIILKLLGEKSAFLDALMNANVKINMTEVLIASVLAAFIGLLEAMAKKKLLHWYKNRNEKNKKVRLSVWDDLFEEKEGSECRVRVILNEQGLIYDGNVEKFSASLFPSLSSNKKELYLKDAIRYDLKTGEELKSDIEGTYVQITDDESVVVELVR